MSTPIALWPLAGHGHGPPPPVMPLRGRRVADPVVPPLALVASDDGSDEEGGGGDMFSEIAIVSSRSLASCQWRADRVLDETLVRRARALGVAAEGACSYALRQWPNAPWRLVFEPRVPAGGVAHHRCQVLLQMTR